ncbi:50S ribosomal protein L19 [Spatholobus suberectus]|nr:50S ribosomal protein L19 [Spatholobus suberectus]
MSTETTSVDSSSHDSSTLEPEVPPRIKFKRLDKTARHIMQILDKEAVEEVRGQREIPDIKPGYIVQLKVEVPENKRRVSIIKGIVIARRNAGLNSTFRIRRLVAGVGVESLFPLKSKSKYLGIWYYNITPITVEWFANVDIPLSDARAWWRRNTENRSPRWVRWLSGGEKVEDVIVNDKGSKKNRGTWRWQCHGTRSTGFGSFRSTFLKRLVTSSFGFSGISDAKSMVTKDLFRSLMNSLVVSISLCTIVFSELSSYVE